MKLMNCCLIVAGLLAAPAPAAAQSEFIKENAQKIIRKVGVRASVGFRDPIDSDVTKGRTLGLSIGFAPGQTSGWRFPVSLTFFSANLNSPSGERFGSVRGTAIVGGIGYGWHLGRLSTGVSLETGYSFNRGRTEGDLQAAFPEGDISLDIDNAFLLRPHAKAEYFITEKFSVRTALDYVWTRPDIRVTTPTREIADRWDASHIHGSVGVAFYPFRK